MGIVAGLIVIGVASTRQTADAPATAKQEIEAFNQKFIDARLKMDNASIIGM